MLLTERTLGDLAAMICGDTEVKYGKNFPYRSSSRLTNFFTNCDQAYVHDGTTRKYWVIDVLRKLNREIASIPDLPSDSLVNVITGVMNADYFDRPETNREQALADLNIVLGRQSLVAFLDNGGQCHLRHDGTGALSTRLPQRPRPLSIEEKAQRERLADYLERASEDEFTEKVLVPFFQRLGFHRVEAAGHREKALEYGKDLWMKFQLPTGHWLYFCAQVKRGKIDAKGNSGGNVAEILNQSLMAMDHEIFDPDVNRQVLLDHLFIISAGEITRAARSWLAGHLDKGQRRHLIFMDRDDFLNHAARIVADLPLAQPNEDAVPF
jgi:hypothetical protein